MARKKKEGPRSALIIVAHPDDAEFLCGATVAKWCAEGWDVNYVLTTSGDMGTKDPEMTRPRLSAIREKEQLAACHVLGVRETVFLRYPDGFVEDTAELRGKLAIEVKRFKPEVVVTWNPYRKSFTHRDHRLTGQAAIDAIYPLARNPLGFPEHLAAGLEPHKVKEVLLAGSEEPDYYIDVTDHIDAKMNALRKHKSQIGGGNMRELRKRLRERMKEVAKDQEFELAEAFRRIVWG